MRKFALLALVAVLSFGFVGCAGSFKDPLSLPDPDQATVAKMWCGYETREDSCDEFYVIVFELRERFATVRVDKATFESVHKGDKVEVELISYTLTQDNVYLLETEYLWKVSGREYPIIFKCDAKERPVPPRPDPKNS